jgi:Skp family chaperone for outer membrane proteins
MGWGKKFGKAVSNIGQKVSHTANKIGQKTNDVIKKVDNKVSKAINDADKFASKVIDKSGQATNIMRKAANITARVAGVANTLLGDIPVVGTAVGLANSAAQAGAKGAKQINKFRDQVDAKRDELKKNIDVEKNNIRKKLEKANNDAVDKVQKFV